LHTATAFAAKVHGKVDAFPDSYSPVNGALVLETTHDASLDEVDCLGFGFCLLCPTHYDIMCASPPHAPGLSAKCCHHSFHEFLHRLFICFFSNHLFNIRKTISTNGFTLLHAPRQPGGVTCVVSMRDMMPFIRKTLPLLAVQKWYMYTHAHACMLA
jgi:hypothetical protein